MPQYSLDISPIHFMVRLGCLPDERELPQRVEARVKITFANAPKGCTSDALDDTICYKTLCDEFNVFCQNKEFALIESLGTSLYNFVRERYSEIAKLTLSITKFPPIANIGTCSFTIED